MKNFNILGSLKKVGLGQFVDIKVGLGEEEG